MIMIEFTTITDKKIAFASNGVLSIKHGNSDITFSKLTKDQAYLLASTIAQWSVEQPEPSTIGIPGNNVGAIGPLGPVGLSCPGAVGVPGPKGQS